MEKVYVKVVNGAVIEVLSEDTYRERIEERVDEVVSDHDNDPAFDEYLNQNWAPSELWRILANKDGRDEIVNNYYRVAVLGDVEKEFATEYEECEVI